MNILTIENKSGKVKLTDAVTPWSVEKLSEDIGKLFGASAFASGADFGVISNAAENAVDTLEIEINSPGGSIFDGYNIYQEIKSLQQRGVVVTATVTGMAASMASVICMACDAIHMVPHARMMIHEASQTVRGNADDLRKSADNLDAISNDIAGIYSNRTGKPLEDIRKMMKSETWMTSNESVEMGFADEVVKFSGNTTATIEKNKSTETMGLFTKSDSQAAIIALESENAEIRENFTALQTAAAESAERVISLRTEVSNLTDEIALVKTALLSAAEELDAASEKLATFDAEIEAAAQAKFESLGGPPIAASSASQESNVKTMAEFNTLTPSAKMTFIKAGGKLKD